MTHDHLRECSGLSACSAFMPHGCPVLRIRVGFSPSPPPAPRLEPVSSVRRAKEKKEVQPSSPAEAPRVPGGGQQDDAWPPEKQCLLHEAGPLWGSSFY